MMGLELNRIVCADRHIQRGGEMERDSIEQCVAAIFVCVCACAISVQQRSYWFMRASLSF